MNICFVANAESVHTVRWISYFVKKGHTVHLISHKGFDIEGVIFHKLITIGSSKITTERIRPLDLLTFVIRALQTRRMIRKIKPDIVHGHNVILGGFYASLSKFHPIIITAWGTDVLIAPKVSFLLKKIAKYVLKNADVITCDGLNTQAAMIDLEANPGKIRIIYFGIDTQKNNPLRRSTEIRERLGLGDAPALISIRNFHPVYNLETLIKAIPLVLAEVPEAKFIIAGTGPGEAGLKELAASLQVEQHAIFTGSLKSEEMPGFLASSDLYVSTSLSDSGLAASTGEAMACGLPVIVTDVGGNREWIREGENGFIIPVRDVEGLAAKIIVLFKNKSIALRFGELNRQIIEERQDYEKEMGKMELIAVEMMDKHHQTHNS